jgi:hypothetical protein
LATQVGVTADADSAGALLARGADAPAAVYQELVLGLAAGTARSGRGWEALSEQFDPSVQQKLDALYAESAQSATSGSAGTMARTFSRMLG